MHRNEASADDYSQRLRAAKRDIAHGIAVTDPAIDPYLLASWQRSHASGLSTGDQLLTAADHPQFIIDDADRDFSAIVGQEIEAIWDSFGGEHWAVYCTNAQGLIVRVRHGTNPASRTFALHVGRRIQECDVGTTAPACALHSLRPVTLVGAEHYLEEFADLFCCAVPVWGPWGTPVGVLNVTGSETFKSRLVEQKLQSAAIKIENRLFLAAHRANTLFRIHYDAEFIDTHLAGLVAVNAFGDILSASRNAVHMLDQVDLFGRRCNLAELFVDGFVATEGYCLKTRLHNGIVFYTKACHATEWIEPSVGDSGSLRDMSQLHVLDVIRQCGGNISRAAKVLGLSRTTLYRTMKRHTGL